MFSLSVCVGTVYNDVFNSVYGSTAITVTYNLMILFHLKHPGIEKGKPAIRFNSLVSSGLLYVKHVCCLGVRLWAYFGPVLFSLSLDIFSDTWPLFHCLQCLDGGHGSHSGYCAQCGLHCCGLGWFSGLVHYHSGSHVLQPNQEPTMTNISNMQYFLSWQPELRTQNSEHRNYLFNPTVVQKITHIYF